MATKGTIVVAFKDHPIESFSITSSLDEIPGTTEMLRKEITEELELLFYEYIPELVYQQGLNPTSLPNTEISPEQHVLSDSYDSTLSSIREQTDSLSLRFEHSAKDVVHCSNPVFRKPVKQNSVEQRPRGTRGSRRVISLRGSVSLGQNKSPLASPAPIATTLEPTPISLAAYSPSYSSHTVPPKSILKDSRHTPPQSSLKHTNFRTNKRRDQQLQLMNHQEFVLTTSAPPPPMYQ